MRISPATESKKRSMNAELCYGVRHTHTRLLRRRSFKQAPPFGLPDVGILVGHSDTLAARPASRLEICPCILGIKAVFEHHR